MRVCARRAKRRTIGSVRSVVGYEVITSALPSWPNSSRNDRRGQVLSPGMYTK